MRSAEAAKNTAGMIEDTVKKVKGGSELLHNTNKAFAGVAESSSKVGQLISEISAASSEQAQGIEQLNRAIMEMDRVVQQNAAGAEESASASEELSAQAQALKLIVGELMAVVGGSMKQKGGKTAFDSHKRQRATQSAKSKSKKILPWVTRQDNIDSYEQADGFDDECFEDFKTA